MRSTFSLAGIRLLLSALMCASSTAMGADKPVSLTEAATAPFTVAAAASMTNVVDAALATWHAEQAFRGQGSYAASSTLARQIEQGAPVHIFISADQKWMDHLAEARLIDPSTRADIASNRLVIITAQATLQPFEWPAAGSELPAALASRRWTTGDPEHVPVGRYAKGALESLHWWEGVTDRLVAAPDVRAALRLVELGEADWGIVYSTDAAAAKDKVRVLATIPAEHHPAVTYPAALVAGQDHPGARAFLAWLQTPAGQDLLRAHGFGIP